MLKFLLIFITFQSIWVAIALHHHRYDETKITRTHKNIHLCLSLLATFTIFSKLL